MAASRSHLAALRHQLESLRRVRRATRWGAAWSAVGTAALVTIGTLWAVDVTFELSVAQRAVMLALGVIMLAWSYRRYAARLLSVHESVIDMALLLERRQGLDTDLVAALQFESPDAESWGSTQLEHAVIERVAAEAKSWDVFAGFSRRPLTQRSGWLALAVAVILGASALYPQHMLVFLNRMLLGNRHYPTATILEGLTINGRTVLTVAAQGTSPVTSAAAQSQPLRFVARCGGVLPQSGLVRISSVIGGATRPVDLTPVSLDQRRAKLAAALALLQSLGGESQGGPGMEADELLGYLDCDAPEAAAAWREAREGRQPWSAPIEPLRIAIDHWPGQADETLLLAGELGRLVESIEYKVFVGDAWTDPARVVMTPRPLIEPVVDAVAPSYAKGPDTVRQLGPGRLTVLEGSSLKIGLKSINQKPLRDAWLTLLTASGPRRWDLTPATGSGANESKPGDGLNWELPADIAEFAKVREDLRFELQVRDEDGLSLETPFAGLVRVQPDRAPSGSLQLIHRVVLPNAKPVVRYRVLDDYGIAKIVLRAEVERPQNGRLPTSAAEELPAEHEASLWSGPAPLGPGQLPYESQYAIDFAPLKLAKGDRVTLTLEATDYRGEASGATLKSEPVAIEISDEAGVLSAVLEADQRAEERLTEIIKRQLGIGEAP